ncbi:MAG TPA: YbaB/EbfC family nucleoid-associated protein [Candidatus Polarisedimenticolaceae bacterium]|nr:YbaB/EbfC family nucleoid-associated protein [Candidatus Polarisedimenticolaceae bacterium]
MFDKAKTLYELKKIQSALAKETIEIETGDGAVKVMINGEQKIKKIELNPELIDGDYSKLEKWLESAVTQAITRSQQLAAAKMKSVAGGLGLPGL